MCIGASGDSSPSRAFPHRGVRWLLTFARFLRRGIRWLLAPQGPHNALNEWESGVLYTRQLLMWGWYHVNERVSSTHGSRWCGAGIMWMKECLLYTADRCWGAGIVWINEQCLPNKATLKREAACLDSGFFHVASAATWETLSPVSALGSPLRSAMEGGCEKPGWCPVLQVRWVRGMRTFSRHELITWVLKDHHWSRADGTNL